VCVHASERAREGVHRMAGVSEGKGWGRDGCTDTLSSSNRRLTPKAEECKARVGLQCLGQLRSASVPKAIFCRRVKKRGGWKGGGSNRNLAIRARLI
jgi:hypothetical protein